MAISLYFSDDSVTQAHLAELAKYRAAQNTNESAQHIPQQPQYDICCKGCAWLNLGKGMFRCKKGFCFGSDNCNKHRTVR